MQREDTNEQKILLLIFTHGLCEIEHNAQTDETEAYKYVIPPEMHISRYANPFGLTYYSNPEEEYNIFDAAKIHASQIIDGDMSSLTPVIHNMKRATKKDIQKILIELRQIRQSFPIDNSKKQRLKELAKRLRIKSQLAKNLLQSYLTEQKFESGQEMLDKSYSINAPNAMYEDILNSMVIIHPDGRHETIFPWTNENGETILSTTLSQILNYLHNGGYTHITIIDFSCATFGETTAGIISGHTRAEKRLYRKIKKSLRRQKLGGKKTKRIR